MAINKNDNIKVNYDKEIDALSLVLKGGREAEYEEIAPGVGVEYGPKGEVIGFEILNASKRLKRALPLLGGKTGGKSKVTA